jgi:signal transduction histidine kinase
VAHATLLVIQGVDQGARFEIDNETVGIGRGVDNKIRILDTEVSRRHAVIEFADDRYTVVDSNSSNGTFLNGSPVRSHALKGGDHIQLGHTAILFDVTADEDDSLQIAEQVNLVGRPELDDRSSIVGEFRGDSPHPILEPEQPTDDTQVVTQTVANLQALYRISEEAVTASLPLDRMLRRILDLSIEVVGADRGCVLVADPQTGEIQPLVFSSREGTDVSERMPVSRSIVNYVLENGQGVRTSNAQHDQRFEPGQSIIQAGIREAVCVPMQGRYQLMGAIYVDTTARTEVDVVEPPPPETFNDEQLRLLMAIGRQSALALENNRYQQALVKAERLAAMGQTIATLSHHIKNILQGVRGGSYLIDRGLQGHEETMVRKGWGIVDKNQNKIYNLVMDMLSFSTERKPAWDRASLNDSVAEVCELLQGKVDEAQLRLDCQYASGLPESAFDSEGIQRAVLNVVGNAIDALDGREDGTIEVRTGFDESTEELFVAVTDNGPGIPLDQVENVFNVFESTKGARGTGLGLAVSRKIVREHGGEITLDSRPGQGCRFLLSWPLHELSSHNEDDSTQGKTSV